MASTIKSPRHFCKMSWSICTTKTFNKGTLKHRRLGKDGFNNQFRNVFCAGFRREFAQQRHSTREPLSTEGWAMMASTTNSPRHLLQDFWGNLHNKDIQQGALKLRRLGKDSFNNQLSKAFVAGFLKEIA